MQQLRLLGLAMMAVLVVGAIVSASAFALENPEILPNPTATAPLSFSWTGAAANLVPSVGKKEIGCKNSTASGKFTSARLGLITIDFTECATEAGASKCGSLGDTKGTILVGSADIHLFAYEEAGKLLLGAAAIFLGELHIECQGGILFLIKGTALSAVSGVVSGVTTKTATLTYAQSKGLQAIRTCKLDKAFCEGKTYELLTNFGGGFESSGEETKAELKFAQEATVDF